jgi:hypothetical protein
MGQPIEADAGPAQPIPKKNDVRQPLRIEMIVNEIAKLEKPPIAR